MLGCVRVMVVVEVVVVEWWECSNEMLEIEYGSVVVFVRNGDSVSMEERISYEKIAVLL